MSVGSIGAIGATPGGGSIAAKGGVGKAASSQGNSGTVGVSKDTYSAPTGNGGQANMCQNMSTSNFISLSQQVNKSGKGQPLDAEKMVQVILALQLLEKVVEAVGKILESVLNPGR